jgi:hypothetical protein
MTANVEELHMSRNCKRPSDTMGDAANGKDPVPSDARMDDMHTIDTKFACFLNEVSADVIGIWLSISGFTAKVWVLVVDGDLRRCWDPGGKFTVLPWASHPVGRLSEFRCELTRLRNSLKGVGVTQHFVQRG